MATITFDYRNPAQNGVDTPASLALVARLAEREVVDGAFRMVSRFDIILVAGQATAELSATGANQYWVVQEMGIANPRTWNKKVLASGPFTDLVDVDPTTALPDPGTPLGDAFLAEVTALSNAAVTAGADAVEAGAAAVQAGATAVGASTTAVQAAAAAVPAASTAVTARNESVAAAASVAPGVANGTATLDGTAKLPAAQVPDYLTPQSLTGTIGTIAVTPPRQSKVAGTKNTRRATLILTGGQPQSQAAVAVDYAQRTIFALPVTPTRFRIRACNRVTHPLGTALPTRTTPIHVSGFWMGKPAFGTDRWAGAATAVGVKVLNSFEVPVDDSDYISPWIDNTDGVYIQAGQLVAPSWGLTTDNAGSGLSQGIATVGLFGAVSAVAANAVPAGGYTTYQAFLGDFRIEYEFEGSTPIGLFVGDSTTDGYMDAALTGTQRGTMPYQRWPEAGGLKNGFCAINLGVSSAQALAFASSALNTYRRVDLTATTPDFAVDTLGINDIMAGNSAAVLIARMRTVIDVQKSFGIPRIYLATIPPLGQSYGVGKLTSAAAVGATSTVTDIALAGGVTLRLGDGVSVENISTTGPSTGSGPYTTPVAALTKTHPVGDATAGTIEAARRDYNDWVRRTPYGTVGFLDFDNALAESKGSAFADPRLMGPDRIHPNLGGYMRMAEETRALGISG